jgi:hypothetical protein
MVDVLEFDLFADGKWILAFDGRVLEIFGNVHPNWNVNNLVSVDAWRIHVKQLNVKVTGPDKKGFREVDFCSPSDPLGAFKVSKLDEAQWGRLDPFLATLANAMRSGSGDSESAELLATKQRAFQGLISQHDIHLSQQPDDVRHAVVSELQAAGVAVDADTLVMKFTDPAQFDAALEIYKQRLLLPADASLG